MLTGKGKFSKVILMCSSKCIILFRFRPHIRGTEPSTLGRALTSGFVGQLRPAVIAQHLPKLRGTQQWLSSFFLKINSYDTTHSMQPSQVTKVYVWFLTAGKDIHRLCLASSRSPNC